MTEQTQPKPLTGLDLDEIEARAAALYEYATGLDGEDQAEADQLTGTDVPALTGELRQQRASLAEAVATVARLEQKRVELERIANAERARVAELEADLARYVGHEPTIAEEMAYLTRCLHAVHDLCDEAGAKGIASGGTFTVDAVRQAADGIGHTPTNRPALPWAHVMDDGDLGMFLDDLVSAALGRWRSDPEIPDRTVLADIEQACARWRTPGQGLRSDEPGTSEGE